MRYVNGLPRLSALIYCFIFFALQFTPVPGMESGRYRTHQERMKILNLLAHGGLGEFKYKFGGEAGGEAVELDDSSWGTIYPGYSWQESNSKLWCRIHIDVPETIGGFSLVGRKMTLMLNVDNGGDVFVNGDSLTSFTWGPHHFTIAESLKAGDRFVIALRAINGPGYGQIFQAEIQFTGLLAFQKKLQEKFWGLKIAARIAREMSDRPDYWLHQIEKVSEGVFNSRAFIKGDEAAFLAAFDKEYERLKPLRDEIKRKYRIFGAGYAHIDLAWLWPWMESVEVVRNTSASVLNIMERFPEFNYTMGQAHAYEWLETNDPTLFKKIQDKVAQGSWEIVGGQWVEPDLNLPSGESLVRQSLYGKRYFRKKFGVDVQVSCNPDVFGCNWNTAQILARSGFTALVTWRPPNASNLFWWEGPDGSRIMCYRAQSGYHHYLNGDQMLDFVQKEAQSNGLGKELVLFGVGNHGGGPTMDMLEKAMVVQNAPVYPEFQLTTTKDFFDALTPSDKAKLPVWKSELYLPRLRGCYTSQALAKKHNRQSEVEINVVEKAATIAELFGGEYPAEHIFNVWRTILFNQFHDVLPGTSIPTVYQDSQTEYAEAHRLCERMLGRAFKSLEQRIDTRGKGEALLVFNPLSWTRTSPVALELDDQEFRREWTVLDEHGNPLPVQKTEAEALGGKLLFMADNVPALGYKVFRLVAGASTPRSTELHFTRHHLENEFLRLEMDASTGLMTTIRDLINNREVLAEPRGNVLQVFTDRATDAWNINYAEPGIDLDQAREVSLVEFGPVRATIKVVHGYKGKEQPAPTEDFPTSIFTQYVSLYDGLPFIEIRNHVLWQEKHKVCKVAFPVQVVASKARYEIPYGSIERSTGSETEEEKAQIEVAAQRWADLSDGEYGVALINDCKHGYDIKANRMRLTLLRAPDYPDVLADRGYHDFRYALLPHKGDYSAGEVTRRSLEFNEPLQLLRTNAHAGELPNALSFVQIEPAYVVLNSLKKAEDDKDWIVRVYETAGKSATVNIGFRPLISRAAEVNLIEDHLGDIPHQKNSIAFTIKPNEIRTFKVRIAN